MVLGFVVEEEGLVNYRKQMFVAVVAIFHQWILIVVNVTSSLIGFRLEGGYTAKLCKYCECDVRQISNEPRLGFLVWQLRVRCFLLVFF